MKFDVLNWEDIYANSHLLFEKIFLDDYKPDMIVAVARGGWIPARLIADFFMIRKAANIKVEAYEVIGETNVEAKITEDISLPVKGKKILIVDDIADSGASLKVVNESLVNKEAGEIKTATLHYKEKSEVIPDYYLEKTDAWVVYPWEYYETTAEFVAKYKEEGDLSLTEMRLKLMEIGLPVSMIDSYFIHYPIS